MVNYAFDCETYGLSAQRKDFAMGCVLKEYGKPMLFYSPEEMWEHILKETEKNWKHKEISNFYGHNVEYDFYTIAELKDNHIHYFCHNPFIATYNEENREIAKFLDTVSLMKMSLKEAGELLGIPKFDMPNEFIEGKRMTKEELEERKEYVIRDTEITLEIVGMIRRKLREDGINLKRLYTIHQVGIQYLLQKLKKNKPRNFFYNEDKNELLFTKFSRKVHDAYRGGRVECFKTGMFQNVYYADCNSLYPFSAIKIPFPDLSKQEEIYNPLQKYDLIDLLLHNGISRTMVYNKEDELGLLAIRTPTHSHYPKKGKYMIGTWTHIELYEAISNGYEIIAIEWSLLFGSQNNPFIDIMPEIYEKRKKSTSKFDDFFYKQMMNSGIGKFAQTQLGQELIIDDIEEIKKYQKNGFELYKGIDNTTSMMYKKVHVDTKLKKYYCPLIPTMINAYARVYMHELLKEIPINDLVYMDTDSILCIGNHLKKLPIGDKLGQFKIEHEGKECLIWGRKTYRIGNSIKAAGIRKSDLKLEDFDKGTIETQQMTTLLNETENHKVGAFRKEVRDFRKQNMAFTEATALLNEMPLYMDCNITNVEFFMDKIKRLGKP